MRLDPPTNAERCAVRRALLHVADELGIDAHEPLARALFIARAGLVARELVDDLVRADRQHHGLRYREIGIAFGITMQSAHLRFRDHRS